MPTNLTALAVNDATTLPLIIVGFVVYVGLALFTMNRATKLWPDAKRRKLAMLFGAISLLLYALLPLAILQVSTLFS